MNQGFAILALGGLLWLSSCARKESAEAPPPAAEQSAAAQPEAGPRVNVVLKDGTKVPGTIVASSKADMTVTGDDGIERKIPMARVKSVEYGESQPVPQARQQAPRETAKPSAAPSAPAAPTAAAALPAATTKTYELQAGSEVSVRTNEMIDSATAEEGQTFDVQVTRDAKDAGGAVVIPRGSPARVVIKSASKGGRIRGASDLVLDLQTVIIDRKPYSLDAADVGQKGKSGVGANKRTATYTGGGAAIGAIIGAIAGGGKGAAIGAGAGAGAGALTQVLTKGAAIKVPAESVLTFQLATPLKVTAAQ